MVVAVVEMGKYYDLGEGADVAEGGSVLCLAGFGDSGAAVGAAADCGDQSQRVTGVGLAVHLEWTPLIGYNSARPSCCIMSAELSDRLPALPAPARLIPLWGGL